MNILSLFDGMSCAQIALNKLQITGYTYFAAELDKYAMKVTQANYPDTVQLGDVTQIKGDDLPKIDLLVGGSPCQGFSFAGKQLNFDDPRSKLFFEYVRVLKECQPKYFLLENVKMKQEYQDVISEALGVEPIEINSALVSAQNRKRLYWTNIPNVSQPEDRGVVLRDVLECGSNQLHQRGRGNNKGGVRDDKSPSMGASNWEQNVKVVKFQYITDDQKSKLQVADSKHTGSTKILFHRKGYRRNTQVFDPSAKTECIDTAGGGGRVLHTIDDVGIRKITPVECERLQTVPDNYTNHVSNTQRYKMLGNGFTIDIITHILRGMYET